MSDVRHYLAPKYHILGDKGEIVSLAEPLVQIFRDIDVLANIDLPVLITGETGTGKDLVARALHYNGLRVSAPFTRVNCAAISESLLESELFGHKKGAFTGALSDYPGRIRATNNGTLFLDEIGDMPLTLQAKILGVLQEREVHPVGDTKAYPVTARFVAATHQDLERMVEKGTFREDLFYRINGFPIHVPPLRERREDIPHIACAFLEKQNGKQGSSKTLSGAMLKTFQDERLLWRGNVRELENAIRQALVRCKDGVLLPEHFVLRYGVPVEKNIAESSFAQSVVGASNLPDGSWENSCWYGSKLKPYSMGELRSKFNRGMTRRMERLLADGYIYAENLSAGESNASYVFYLTPQVLPALNDAEAQKIIAQEIQGSDFVKVASHPFRLVSPSMLASEGNSFGGKSSYNLAYFKAQPYLVASASGPSPMIFALTLENATFFVPRNNPGREEAMKNKILAAYRRFCSWVPKQIA